MADITKMIEEIKNMTVMELSELVKAIEEEFGVSAAAAGVADILGLGLKESKELVDAAPKSVKAGISKEEADEIAKKLQDAGASVELK